MKELVKIAYRNLISRKLRAWLTMLGIFVGIAGVVTLIALGNGLESAVFSEFEDLGFNRIIIQPAGAAFGPLSGELSTVTLTDKDLNAIRKASGVRYGAGLIAKTANVKYRGQTEDVNVFFHATDRETLNTIEASNLFNLDRGRDLRKSDIDKTVVGNIVALEKFDRKISTGEDLEIFGTKVEVVGITQKVGSPVHDGSIRIPTNGIERFADLSDSYTILIAMTHPDADVEEVAVNIEKKLRQSRDVKEGKEDFSVQSPKQILDAVFAIFGVIQAVIVAIAAIALIVGGVGIMNTMYTSVLDRTKEIGIMKAIGARNSDILLIFMFESGVLGFFGGLIGIIIGYISAEFFAFAARMVIGSDLFQVSISFEILAGLILFSFLIGSFSGLLPAIQAANLKPVDALRYE